MQAFLCLLAIFSTILGFSADNSPAIQRLKRGNSRYMKDESTNPDRNAFRRNEVAAKQSPFAVIVGCSDSRVPPEIIFDEGIGDLFTIRVAGNVVGPLELDSVEYATEYLGASFILIMGHESCGAVTTVLQGDLDDIEDVAQLILPAVQGIAPNNVEAAVKANVRSGVNYLKQTTSLKRLLSQGKLEIAGAYYHLKSGFVEFLD